MRRSRGYTLAHAIAATGIRPTRSERPPGIPKELRHELYSSAAGDEIALVMYVRPHPR
jgi:hypothetical protein